MSAKRIEVTNCKNVRLARLLRLRIRDALNLEVIAEQAHWEVKGPNHLDLHGLFDEIHVNMSAHVVELAAVIKELDCSLPSGVGPQENRHAVAPYTEDSSTGHGHVTELAERLAEISRRLHRMQRKVTRLGDNHAVTACAGLMRDVDTYYHALKLHLRPRH